MRALLEAMAATTAGNTRPTPWPQLMYGLVYKQATDQARASHSCAIRHQQAASPRGVRPEAMRAALGWCRCRGRDRRASGLPDQRLTASQVATVASAEQAMQPHTTRL